MDGPCQRGPLEILPIILFEVPTEALPKHILIHNPRILYKDNERLFHLHISLRNDGRQVKEKSKKEHLQNKYAKSLVCIIFGKKM